MKTLIPTYVLHLTNMKCVLVTVMWSKIAAVEIVSGILKMGQLCVSSVSLKFLVLEAFLLGPAVRTLQKRKQTDLPPCLREMMPSWDGGQ
jgi:hypothetical protein